MFLKVIHYTLWVLPAILQALIVVIMAGRRLFGEFPLFFIYTVSHVIRFGALFYFHGVGDHSYRIAYAVAEGIDAGLAIAVMYELFADALRGFQAVRQIGWTFVRWATVLLLLVAVVASAGTPQNDQSTFLATLYALERSINIVRGGLLGLLFVFTAYFTRAWRSYGFGIALGFGLATAVDLATVTLRAASGIGTTSAFSLLSSIAYNLAVIIWLGYLFVGERKDSAMASVSRADVEAWNKSLSELLRR